MPDWVHSVLYIIVVAAVVLLVFFHLDNIWGLVVGLLVGHFIASFLVSRLPGFWDNRGG